MSIKTRLIIAVSSLIIVILASISYLALSYFETNTKETIARGHFTSLSVLAAGIDDKLTKAHEHLGILSGKLGPELIRDAEKAQSFLADHDEIRTIFSNGLFLFSAKGALVAESPFQGKARRGRDFSFREYLSATLAGRKPYVGEPYFSSLSHGHPAIMLTAPVFDAKGTLIGVLGGSIDLVQDNVFSHLMNLRIGTTGYFYIINKDRRIILHPDRDRILKQDVPVGANKLLEEAIKGFEGTGETITSRGLHAITSFKQLKAKDWLVASNYPVAEAYAPIYKARTTLLIVMTVTILLVAVIVFYLMNALINPLLAFTRHVESIPGKEREARLMPVSSHDEIGRLTHAVNRMVADLGRRQGEIESQRERLAVTLGSIADGVIVTDTDGTVELINGVAENLSGVPREEALGMPLRDVLAIVDEKSRERLPDPVLKVVTSGAIESLPLHPVLISRGGAEYFISGNCAPVRNADNRIIGAVLVFQDVTDRKRAEEALRSSERRLTDIIDFLPDATFAIDLKGRVTIWNRAAEEYTGVKAEDILGKGEYEYSIPFYGVRRPVLIDLVLSPSEEIKKLYPKVKREDGFVSGEGFNLSAKRGKAYMLGTAAPLYDADGNVAGAIESVRDITERKRAEEKLLALSERDHLTRIYNRRKFLELLKSEMGRANRYNRPLSLIIFDLDHFKKVNDTYGHDIGDHVLAATVDIVSKITRSADVFARYGGEEFVILSPETNVEGALVLAEKVRAAVEQHHYRTDGTITISAGISQLTSEDSSDTFIKKADEALYAAKNGGRNRVVAAGQQPG
jgi:diguanylate cyclase (GGDEF)-like protein/PAS domain S-box-containing protein